MLIKLIAAPVIGAIIGYCTNWIAVKMLFRPRKPLFIGKFHVPLTPGVIPKGKERLANAVGSVLNEQLLTREAVRNRLLSDEMIAKVKEAAAGISEKIKGDQGTTIRQLAGRYTDETGFEVAVNRLETVITDKAYERLLEADLGSTVSEYMYTQVREMMNGSMLGMMFGDSLLSSVGPMVEDSVNNYIQSNGHSIIATIVRSEMHNIAEMPVERVVNGIEDSGYDIAVILEDLYRRFADEKAFEIISAFDMGSIARDSIIAMDNEQLEELVLTTMRTELNAVVNFGALIGLILGLVNMGIYFI